MAVNNSFLFEFVRSTHQNLVLDAPIEFKEQLAYYRAFYLEGENLEKFCKEEPRVYYTNRFQKDGVATSIVAALQLNLIKTSIAALYSYSKELEIPEAGFDTMGVNLIAESCSQNISVVSHRRLRKMFIDIKKQPLFELPSIKNNPFFTKKIDVKQSKEERLAKEMYYTLGLFKVACSWGQDVSSLRGVAPVINNSIIASYVIRQMLGLDIAKDVNVIERGLVTTDKTTRVHCDGIICREKKVSDFLKDFPKSIGQQSLSRDLKSVYCSNLAQHKKDQEIEVSESLTKIYTPFLGDDSRRLIGQYMALITKIPDFNVWSNNPQILGEYIKLGLSHFWDGWAKNVLSYQVENLKYEEPLELEVVDHKKFLPPSYTTPRVQLDLNSGEFDKLIAINGKLKFKFNIDILERDLLWLYFRYRQTDPTLVVEIEKFDHLLLNYIENNFKNVKNEFSNYLISGNIPLLIRDEIKKQLRYIDQIAIEDRKVMMKIPVEINISPFALVYLKNKRIMEDQLLKEVATSEQFQSIKRIDAMATEPNK